LAWFTFRVAEIAMVIDQHSDAGPCQRLGIEVQIVMAGQRDAVGHHHTGNLAIGIGRAVQPARAPCASGWGK
jgi:hypothetical protein